MSLEAVVIHMERVLTYVVMCYSTAGTIHALALVRDAAELPFELELVSLPWHPRYPPDVELRRRPLWPYSSASAPEPHLAVRRHRGQQLLMYVTPSFPPAA